MEGFLDSILKMSGPVPTGSYLSLRSSQAQQLNKKVFGVALDQNATEIPEVLQIIGRYFEEKDLYKLEGIFRVTGNLNEIRGLKEQFDKGQAPDLSAVRDGHVVAGLLKLYFRELPIPLLTFDLYDCFLAAAAIKDEEATLSSVKNVLGMLPRVNVLIIKFLAGILKKITQYSSINKMTAMNLAIVFAPSLLRPPDVDGSGRVIGPDGRASAVIDEKSLVSQMQDAPYANKLMELFIKHADAIFTKEWERQMEENLAKQQAVKKFESTASGKYVPVPPERTARRRINTDTSFAMYLMKSSPRVSFRVIEEDQYLCTDGGFLKANYTHDSNSFQSKKELFRPEWHDTQLALIACDNSHGYITVDKETNTIQLSEKPKEPKAHLFEVEIMKNDYIVFRSVLTNKHLGVGEDKKVILVEEKNKQHFQLCLKVGLMTSLKKYLRATAIWRSPWPGGDSLTGQEMFLIHVEKEKKYCSICHYEPMRGGKRYCSVFGEGWKLSGKAVTEKEHWVLTAIEIPMPSFGEPEQAKSNNSNNNEKESGEKEKEKTGLTDSADQDTPLLSIFIQNPTTQCFMRSEKGKVLMAAKDYVVDEAAIFQLHFFGV